jgi:hypothetical protein
MYFKINFRSFTGETCGQKKLLYVHFMHFVKTNAIFEQMCMVRAALGLVNVWDHPTRKKQHESLHTHVRIREIRGNTWTPSCWSASILFLIPVLIKVSTHTCTLPSIPLVPFTGSASQLYKPVQHTSKQKKKLKTLYALLTNKRTSDSCLFKNRVQSFVNLSRNYFCSTVNFRWFFSRLDSLAYTQAY